MIAATLWTFLGILVGIGFAALTVSWIAYLIYLGTQGMEVEMNLPAFLPWSEASKLRRTRLQRRMAEEQVKLWDAKHTAKQREMVYGDLEEKQITEYRKRAHERGLPQPEDE
jgi:hypothetical protein